MPSNQKVFIYALLFTTSLLSLKELAGQKIGGFEDKKINKLVILFSEGEYGRVILRTNALKNNDKYKKNPLPYIYSSMSYFEISKKPYIYGVEEKNSPYKKPVKKALKQLYYHVKKDKKKDYKGEFGTYFVALSDTISEIAQAYVAAGKYRQARTLYKKMSFCVPEDPILKLWQGISEIRSKYTKEGKKSIKQAMADIDKEFTPDTPTSSVLLSGLIQVEELATNYDTKLSSKAKELIPFFEKYDPEFMIKEKNEKERIKREKEEKQKTIVRSFSSEEEEEEDID